MKEERDAADSEKKRKGKGTATGTSEREGKDEGAERSAVDFATFASSLLALGTGLRSVAAHTVHETEVWQRH